jgi:hypothetical protein
MNPGPTTSTWTAAIGWGATALSLCGFGAGLLLLPQRLLQRPLAAGVIAVHLEPGGQLRLWQKPTAAAELEGVLEAAGRRRSPPRLRLVPDPRVPWGEVRQALVTLDRGVLPVELQLPAPQPHP